MKKLLVVLILLLMILPLCACNKKNDYSQNISQIRSDIFYGENDDYTITAYSEKREKPFKNDGIAQAMGDIVILKITLKQGTATVLTATFTLDREYSAEFSFINVNDAFVSSVSVASAPTDSFTVSVNNNSTFSNVQLYSIKDEKTITYDTALSSVVDSKCELINSLSGETLNAEIHLRLISNEEKSNMWYVGIVTEEKTYAFLLDGKTAKILAEREVLHNLLLNT